MTSAAKTPEEYVNELPEDRKEIIQKFRMCIQKNIPNGFEEIMNYGMIGFVVPHSIYPKGYHCNPKEPLPFIGLASQKNNISFYHMGIYVNQDLLNWFTHKWDEKLYGKLDMGKSCIRLKKMDKIPFDLIAELCSKMNTQDWIDLYEKSFNK